MRVRRSTVLTLCVCACVLGAGGCIDALREGVTHGLEEGVSTSIATVFEFFLGALSGGS